MDTFRLIQKFFAHMTCDQCKCHYEPAGIQLIRQEEGLFVVSVYCNHCQQQMGVAMVGVESRDINARDLMSEEDHDNEHDHQLTGRSAHTGLHHRYAAYDPELPPAERRRLSEFAPVSSDDVIEAHRFLQNLDAGWSKYLPSHLQASIVPDITPDRPAQTDSETVVQNVPEVS